MRRSENSRERRASGSDTLRPNELKSAELSKKKENHVSDALKREYANEKNLKKKRMQSRVFYCGEETGRLSKTTLQACLLQGPWISDGWAETADFFKEAPQRGVQVISSKRNKRPTGVLG